MLITISLLLLLSQMKPLFGHFIDVAKSVTRNDIDLSVKCSVGHLHGHCTFVLECLVAGRYPLGSCRNGWMIGSCCTKTATVSAVAPNQDGKEENEKECGEFTSFPNINSRIVNGSSAAFGQIPWIASLRINLKEDHIDSTHFCGATLINHEWVATSAHCMWGDIDDIVVVRLGEYNSNTEDEPLPHIDRRVILKVTHPDFRLEDFYSDIALLKLNSPVEFAPNIRPICLPGTDDSLAGKSGVVSGWGRVGEISSPSEVLQTISLPIMPNRNCELTFMKGKVRENIHDRFLCAGYEDGRQDACTGDSGGPLQVLAIDGRVFLAGIVSWGYGCARPFKPGVYSRVSKFVPWILEVLKANSP